MVARVVIAGDSHLLSALENEMREGGIAEELSLESGDTAESERLAFELRDLASLAGIFVSGAKAIQFAAALVRARAKSGKPVLEFRTPRGRVTLDLTGKSKEEIADLVSATYPFLN